MKKPSSITRSSGPNSMARANREYKQKIYALCSRVLKGDKAAEEMLSKELETKTLARWALKHYMKRHASRRKKAGMGPSNDGLPPSRAKARTQPVTGNPFKPYRGGSPGLGKRA